MNAVVSLAHESAKSSIFHFIFPFSILIIYLLYEFSENIL
jgi:hypothetical protein